MLVHDRLDDPARKVQAGQVVVQRLDRRRRIGPERRQRPFQEAFSIGSRGSTVRTAAGTLVRIGPPTTRKRGGRMLFMQPRRVFEQRPRAVER
ncbi:hypothetical protein, partial [Virgisporangium aurantiacum]|uniref:hypothetical protein n=1 Tax=Virgisporangium aurantiacum TaxID=175570 RepID=UPI0019527F6D